MSDDIIVYRHITSKEDWNIIQEDLQDAIYTC